MTACTEFPSPCEAFQKHPNDPSGPNGQEQHWMEHQTCVQNVLTLCCHLYHGFALAITLQLVPWTSSPGSKGWTCGLAEQLSHLFYIQRCPTFCSGHLHLPLLWLCARFSLLSCILSSVPCFPEPDPGQNSCCSLHPGPVALEEILWGYTIPMEHGKWEGREARLGLCLLEKIWSNISELPRPFMWYQPPGSQGTEQVPLTSSLYSSWQWSHQHQHQQLHPNTQVLVLASPCALYPQLSESYIYKLSLPRSWCNTAKYLSDSHRTTSETSQGWPGNEGSDSSTGSRFGSGGGQLRNLCCTMTGIKDWNTQVIWLEVSCLHSSDPHPHLIPSLVRAHPFLTYLMFIFSPLVPCLSLLSRRSSSPESSVCMMRTQVKHTFLLSFCP